MPILEDVKEYIERRPASRPGNRSSELAREKPTRSASRMTVYPQSSPLALRHVSERRRSRRRHDPAAVMEDLSRPTVGAIPGATASTTTSTITRIHECSASRAAKVGCASAATRAGSHAQGR